MKKAICAVAFTLLLTVVRTVATVTISGTASNVQDTLGVDISTNRLTLLLIDAGDDPIASSPYGWFGDLYPGTLATNTFYANTGGDNDNFIARMGASISFAGDSRVSFPATTLTLGTANGFGDSLSAGDNYYLVWFPDVVAGTTVLSGGEWYGWVHMSNIWQLPSDGGLASGTVLDGFTHLSPDGYQQVIVIPEPKTVALIFMGGFLCLIRRRRA